MGGDEWARFHPQAPSEGTIPRPRLTGHLAGRFDRRLSVVVAGAGYGKTTALVQAVEENRVEPRGVDVWLQVRNADRTPAFFLASLADALGGDPTLATDVDAIGDLVLLRAPEAVAVILDDAHLLQGSPTWAMIEQLMEALPRNAHLVLGTRSFPDLSVRRLQVSGDAGVIDERDLAFTPDELAELASVLGTEAGVELPAWPALAVLSATAGRDASLGYLWEEILREIPPTRRRALALVSRLDDFDDELVAAAAGPEWTAATLVDGLPLVTAGGSSTRLHALWQAVLAEVVPPEQWRPALVAAAAVHRARADLVRATTLLRDAGDVDQVRALVREYVSLPISARLSRAEAQVLFDLLPLADQDGPVGLGLLSVLLWTPDEVDAALRRMLDQATQAGDDEMRALAWWRRVQLQGDTDPSALTVSAELAALADAGWPLARSAVALVRSHQAQEAGDVETALAVLDDLGGPHPQTRRVALASRHVALGHPELVPVTLDDVLAEGVSDPVAAQAVWFRGDIDPDLAWPVASGLPVTYGARRLAAVEVPLLSMVAAVALSVGEVAEARALADTARGRVALVAPRLSLFAHVADALVALSEHGDDECARRMQAAMGVVPLEPWPAWAHLGALTPIRALLPGTEWLDDLDLGPSMQVAVAAGRAVAELRAGRPAAAAALPWASPVLLRVHVPPPLLCELALAADTAEARAVQGAVPSVPRWARRLLRHPHGEVADRAGDLVTRLPTRPGHDLAVMTLGGLEVARNDGVAVSGLDRRRRLRQLLGRLVVERSCSRVTVGEEMWPDLDADSAANNLRVTLAKLLDVLEPDRQHGQSWWLRTVGDRLELGGEGLTLDTDQFDRHLAAARAAEAEGSPSVAYGHYHLAVELYRGPFLADLDDAWVLHERLRLQTLAYAAACRMAEVEAARGEPEAAMAHAQAALRIDLIGERAHRILIGCHLALGATDAARATAEALAERLGPSGADLDLLRRLARPRP